MLEFWLMNHTITFPFYAKLSLTLLSTVLLLGFLYYGQDILVPLLLAMLFAILLRPIVSFLNGKLRIPNILASLIAVLLFVAFVLGIFYFISAQVSEMAQDWGKIKQNMVLHWHHLQDLLREKFNLSAREQQKLLDDATKDSMQTGKELVGSTLMSFTDVFMNAILIPIYTFLFLLYRTHFIKFLCKLFTAEHHAKLRDIMGQVKVSIQSYILGLLIEMVAVSVLTAIGFMIIGLKYWILLGVITGVLNLIPYIGILIAGVLSVVASLTGSADLSIIIGIVVVNIVVQFIDNNLLVPMIVSSKVQINALVSIVGIIIGGALGGFSGMFLAIPLIAILKVVFDRIKPLEPWGYLMGDDLPKTFQWQGMKLPRYSDAAADEAAFFTTTTSVKTTTDTTSQPTQNPQP